MFAIIIFSFSFFLLLFCACFVANFASVCFTKLVRARKWVNERTRHMEPETERNCVRSVWQVQSCEIATGKWFLVVLRFAVRTLWPICRRLINVHVSHCCPQTEREERQRTKKKKQHATRRNYSRSVINFIRHWLAACSTCAYQIRKIQFPSHPHIAYGCKCARVSFQIFKMHTFVALLGFGLFILFRFDYNLCGACEGFNNAKHPCRRFNWLVCKIVN